ncbi:uncharacterized protein M421DRAFT_426705 [Didymella exigua CBS 183.55]|uniref:DNA-directed RNA polymerase I subunit RPA34.5 n=1 Tax=Didymella exigua CBS 183.55 TaxID=1150837 RepID=A0A6A5R7E9_9PLEO|nr:uncharacterized protein M421DRAFT_426705 [Didymella exigua CBS 183.55]KAF1922636.1 hypothetical protein M421DRAFT_426705 [Didymella exigua CBS 183.55]
MSAKKTPVPLPGSKPKKSKVPLPKTSLSRELVGSDDDSSTESAPKTKKAEKPKATIGVHRPNGAAKSSTKKNSSSKSAPQAKSAPKKPAPKTISNPEQVVELSSSEVSDDSDAPARDIQSKLPGEVEMKDASSDSDSDSKSDSSSEEEEAAKPALKPTQAAHSKSVEVELRAAKPYQPPKGFNLVSEKDRTGSKAAKIFENLQGKQIWHITAPAGVSLKELQTIAMDKAMKGDAILSHQGTNYGFSTTEKSEDGPREVLVPGKHGYRTALAKIQQTLHLQELVRLPKLTSKQADPRTGSEAAASITRSTIRAPRPQVKGLKMRYTPLGFTGAVSGGVLGDTDSEEDEVPQERAGLAAPNGLNLPTKAAKRRHSEANGDEVPTKKAKKHRTPEELKKREEKKAKKEKKAKA